MRSPVVRRLVAAGFSVAVVITVGGCGDAPSAAPAPRHTAANGEVFNDADAAFARDLLKQRAEEFALIDLTVGRTLDPGLATFVDHARETRATDVDATTTWLTDWDREVPPTVRDHAAGHAGVHAFPEVEKASDADFATAWVEAFLAELEDSDRIAAAEERSGVNAAALDLAAHVDTTNDDEADALEDRAA